MFVLTEDGVLVEGKPISTKTEKALSHFKNAIDNGEMGYISNTDRKRITTFIASNYEISLIIAPQVPQDALTQAPELVIENLANMPEESI